MVWHLFFTGPCRSIESQHDCEEHRLVMELHWHWRRRAQFAFCRFTFRYVNVNFSWKKVGSGFNEFFIFSRTWGTFPIWLIFFRLVETTKQIRYCLILFNTCMEYFSSFTSWRLHPLSPTSVLLPSHVRDSWKIWPNSWTPVQHWCRRSLEHQ